MIPKFMYETMLFSKHALCFWLINEKKITCGKKSKISEVQIMSAAPFLCDIQSKHEHRLI